MKYIVFLIVVMGIIAGMIFLQLLFGEYLLAQDKENMALRIMEYSDESMKQIPKLKKVLYELDDILARSLPPEEYESDEMLERMDAEKKQMQASHIYLIAFLSDYYDALSYKNIEFRCSIGIPDAFQKHLLELLVLYDYLLTIGQDAVEYEQNKRLKWNEDAQDKLLLVKADQIRIRESSQFGLWHLHMDISISDANWHYNSKIFTSMIRQRKTLRYRRVLRRLLNKHHLKWRSKYTGNRFEIDIIT